VLLQVAFWRGVGDRREFCHEQQVDVESLTRSRQVITGAWGAGWMTGSIGYMCRCYSVMWRGVRGWQCVRLWEMLGGEGGWLVLEVTE
jgi:hypothetical protein